LLSIIDTALTKDFSENGRLRQGLKICGFLSNRTATSSEKSSFSKGEEIA
jgi:hypothetical protein